MDLREEQSHPQSRIDDPVAMALRDPFSVAIIQPELAGVGGGGSIRQCGR